MFSFGLSSILLLLLNRFPQYRNKICATCSISNIKNSIPQMSILGLNTARHCRCPNNGPLVAWFSPVYQARAAFIPVDFNSETKLEAFSMVSAPVMAFPVTPSDVCSQFYLTLGTVSSSRTEVPSCQYNPPPLDRYTWFHCFMGVPLQYCPTLTILCFDAITLLFVATTFPRLTLFSSW